MSSSIALGAYSHNKINPRAKILQERLDVDLQSTDRILEFVLLQHRGVQDTKRANNVLLAADANVNGGRVSGEVGRVYGSND